MDCGIKESSSVLINNNNLKNERRRSKLERYKSLSSAGKYCLLIGQLKLILSSDWSGSWETGSEDDCPPLASEDSDIGDVAEFESFSGTEDEEEDEESCSLSVTAK